MLKKLGAKLVPTWLNNCNVPYIKKSSRTFTKTDVLTTWILKTFQNDPSFFNEKVKRVEFEFKCTPITLSTFRVL